ncbi:MAG TPA: glycerophosphodiester phosphodiesterase [Pyrinomonadaceae bacterium]|nr:glycerophosphodiester phosphodiesterase [Pyrinomonadaceae bacterium]
MLRRRAKWLAAFLLGGVLLMGGIYGALVWSAGEPARDHPFFKDDAPRRPLVIAHRGGAGLWPENTLHAFERAAKMGVEALELDVRLTADGALVVIHDAAVDRTTDGRGLVGRMTLEELKRLDAAHNFSADGGRTFPLRGQGVAVPTLAEVFEALPSMRFVIEPKQGTPSPTRALCRAIEEHSMAERVVVGSFSQEVLEEFRGECPRVATSAGPREVSRFLALQKTGLSASFDATMQALQVPERVGGARVLTREFVEAAHERNLEVHAWTVNDEAGMRALVEMRVDGIMTDYPDRLMRLLGRDPSP